MPVLNTRLKEPLSALLYSALGGLALSVFIILASVLFTSAGGACSGSLCLLLAPGSLSSAMTVIILIILIYPFLSWYLFSYELTGNTITVNSGILFRQYETIDFGRIQTIENERGPLLWLFGLTMVKIWTASAGQLNFSVGDKSTRARPRPDTVLVLAEEDAARLKDFIMRSKTAPTGL